MFALGVFEVGSSLMNKIAGRSASLLGTCYFYFFWNPIMTLGSVHLVIVIEQNHWKNKDNSKKINK